MSRHRARMFGVAKTEAQTSTRGQSTLWSGLLALAVTAVGVLLRLGTLSVMAKANEGTLAKEMQSWDSVYYLEIARHGYMGADVPSGDTPDHEVALAFFPGFPMLIRAVSAVTGLEALTAAYVVNFLATVALAWGAIEVAQRFGAGRWAQAGAAAAVTGAPMAIVFSMPYTEALFGALVIWSLIAIMDRRWLLAGGLIVALGFVRLTAVGMILTLFVMVVLTGRKDWRAWAALVVSPWPLLGYIAWASSHLEHVGGYFGNQDEHWNSGFDFGVATAKWVWEILITGDNLGYGLSTLAILVVPVLLVATFRDFAGHRAWPVWAFSVLLAANVLLADGIMHSRPRLLLPVAMLLIPLVVRWERQLPRWGYVALVAGWLLCGAWFSGHLLAVFDWAI